MKKETYWEQWRKENWFWLLVYGLILGYFLIRLGAFWQPEDHWNVFKEAIALPLVFLLAAVFINLFSNRIVLPPLEETKEPEKAERLERINKNQSLQRRNWMIFAYGFMLFSLLVPIYIFGPGWDKAQTPGRDTTGGGGADGVAASSVAASSVVASDVAASSVVTSDVAASGVQNDAFHPMAVFIGCVEDDPKSELSCASPAQPPAQGYITKSAWALNLGGHVVNAAQCNKEDNSAAVCRVRGGLLVPLYVIILALMGGSISLTRRLPEYQKCANPQYVSTGKEKRLTQHEFREYLIFQIVQFVSAPLIAILAYFLIDPDTAMASVVLAFTSGFASESILIMVRSVTEKVTPTNESPKNGTVSGVVTLAGTVGQAVENVEIVLTAAPLIRALTDKSGFYVLHNVPVGEHGVKVSLTDYEPVTGSVKIERAQELVKQHWVLEKRA